MIVLPVSVCMCISVLDYIISLSESFLHVYVSAQRSFNRGEYCGVTLREVDLNESRQ